MSGQQYWAGYYRSPDLSDLVPQLSENNIGKWKEDLYHYLAAVKCFRQLFSSS